MKTFLSIGSLLALAVVAAPLSANAQSITRIRKSIDKATGGATAAPARPGAPGTPGTPTQVQTSAALATANAQTAAQLQAQATAADALANKRNQAALVGADDRVIAFLKERIANGSADAAYDLAKRYDEGKGVIADPVEARRLYTLAAERDNEDAKKWLEEHPAPKEPAVDPKTAGSTTNAVVVKKPEADAKPADKPADKPAPEAEKAKK